MNNKKTKTLIKYLPLEIWTLILARISGKTLLKFRCVCKPWRSIIDDDPDFVYLHLQLSNNTKIDSKNYNLVAFDIASRSNHRRKGDLVTIRRADYNLGKIGHNLMSSETDDYFRDSHNGLSCNGLILMWQIIDHKKILRLWNPSIRKSLLIPPCPIPPRLHRMTEFLFGFAPSTKEHKILAITFDETPGTQPRDMFFAVFTLSDKKWTVRNNGFNVERTCFERICRSYRYQSNTIFFQGAVHCIPEDDLYEDNKNHLVSLDFDSEKFTFMEFPADKSQDVLRFLMFILGKSLAVLSIGNEDTRLSVLEHNGGKRVWTSRSRPSTRDGLDLFMGNLHSRALYYKSDDFGDCLLMGKKLYHIESGIAKELVKSMGSETTLEPYLESLVLHK